VLDVAVDMNTSRLVALTLALLLGTTTACSSTRGRQVAYAAGGAAIVGGAALAIGSHVQSDEQDDVPFHEIGVGLGIGLAVVGAIAVMATVATEPDPAPQPAAPMANVDETLRALAAAR
jgi:hypothetical protein